MVLNLCKDGEGLIRFDRLHDDVASIWMWAEVSFSICSVVCW